MTGFTEIEQPAEAVNGTGGIEQASADILDFMGQDVDAPEQQEPAQAESETAVATAEEVVEERPEDEASQREEDIELLAPEYLDRKVKFRENGEDVELTVKGLIEGFQVQSSNKRTAQELAQQRQQLEAQFSEITNQRQQYGQLLQTQQEQLEALIPQEPDWGSLASQNPETYQRQRAAWDQLQSRLNEVKTERERVNQETMQTHQQMMAAYLQQQNEALVNALPELKDDGKRKEFFTGIANYAQHNLGFSPQELAMVNDHRLWTLADKARKYDELQSGAETKKGSQSIPTLKGGQSPNDKPSSRKLREVRAKFNKTGDTRDAARLIEQLDSM